MKGPVPFDSASIYTRPFVLAALANFFFFSNLNAFTLLPLYIQELGGREGQIGAIMSMQSVAALGCNLALGPQMDRWGRKPPLLLAAALGVVTSAGFALSGRLGWHFFALRLLQGGAFAVFIIGNLTLLADLVPPSRHAEAVGIFGTSGLVTIALAPAIGEIVFRAYGFPILFAASALVGLAALGLTWATPVPVPSEPETPGPLWRGFLRASLAVLVAGLQFGLANSVVFVFLPPYAIAVGLPRVGPFYMAILTGVTAGALGFGWLAEQMGYRAAFVALGGFLMLGAGAFRRRR